MPFIKHPYLTKIKLGGKIYYGNEDGVIDVPESYFNQSVYEQGFVDYKPAPVEAQAESDSSDSTEADTFKPALELANKVAPVKPKADKADKTDAV